MDLLKELMELYRDLKRYKDALIDPISILTKDNKDYPFSNVALPTKRAEESKKYPFLEELLPQKSKEVLIEELREEIVKKLKRDNNIDANISQILTTVGAIEGLAASVMATIDPGDEVSRIVDKLKPGAGVVTNRADVHYVVTEFGVGSLHGKSLQERARQMIKIAHPDFREELERAAKERKLL